MPSTTCELGTTSRRDIPPIRPDKGRGLRGNRHYETIGRVKPTTGPWTFGSAVHRSVIKIIRVNKGISSGGRLSDLTVGAIIGSQIRARGRACAAIGSLSHQ